MIEFWNERYAASAFAYGKEPNQFLAENIQYIPQGKVLFPAEGEGRNAVYAAQKGQEVFAFDTSSAAKEKALKLAEEIKVAINYQVGNVFDLDFEELSFDGIVLIYAHFPREIRKDFHQQLLRLLKQGGAVIFEAFSKEQIKYTSGGPKSIEMLFSEEEVIEEFRGLDFDFLSTELIELNEGQFHQGRASVVRFKATKK
jgi:SAM-dependent methyltransferase